MVWFSVPLSVSTAISIYILLYASVLCCTTGGVKERTNLLELPRESFSLLIGAESHFDLYHVARKAYCVVTDQIIDHQSIEVLDDRI